MSTSDGKTDRAARELIRKWIADGDLDNSLRYAEEHDKKYPCGQKFVDAILSFKKGDDAK